ncbi:filamentous hemagglutinin, partial [Pseudomonas congelans]
MRVDVAGTVDNQNGRIIAQNGDLNLSAANLYSQGGVLSSLQGLFTSNVSGVLKNGYDANRQGGVIQAQRLNLTALGGFDNYGGRVSARGGEALITTPGFDNRNGGLYAKGLVRVTGGNFDNSGDNDGQIAGGQVELNLSGALNNRFGIIESDSTLAVTAASLDNQTGQLRALGGGGATNFQIGNLFDNRNGTLESANSDLILNAGSFLNGGGSLLHTGNGTFDISTANLTNAGGSIVTRGGLTLSADSWANSNVIQAGRLTVNVNNFSQTASGQLLASTSLVGNGGNWNNDGLIASDGSLSLNLGGTYGGNGRLSSLGTLGLSAAQVNLNAASTISGGGDTSVTMGGQLSNAGRLTSATNLTINAGSINNQGTLGSGQALTVNTGSLVNDRGLIFSGGDMSLRVSSLNNSYANIYSLGNLTIDRNGQGALADSIVNSSASIQSDGSMSLAASTIQNIRAILTTSNGGIYSAKIVEGACNRKFYNNDCKTSTQTHTWDLTQREKLEVTAASAASSITAGGNLGINGGDLINQSSTIATSGNLTATLNNLTNTGVETSDTETVTVYRSMRTDNASMWTKAARDFTDKYWLGSSGYDASLTGLQAAVADFVRIVETDMPELYTVTRLSGGDQSYAAIIQAAGAVNVNAQNNINNSVVRAGYTYVSGGSRTDTSAPGSQFSTRITVNQQLPPDLAQQQVNPLSLPGFSLPTGQNGLFRLSGQTGTAATVAQPVGLPQSWTMGSAAVSVAQREHTVSDAQASTIQIGSVGQISNATRQLASVTRQGAGVSANASSFDASAPGAASIGGFVLPGHTSDSAGVTSVDSVTGIATGNQGSGALLPVQNAGSTGLPVITATGSGSSAAQNIGMVQGTRINSAGQVVTDAQGRPVTTTVSSPVAAAAAQTVTRVEGLPSSNFVSKPQKYLIETNPVLTELKQFMSSDYLLAGLGYDPEVSAKRLGDGLYEQRLVQQAVVARTGQAFIDGQTSNEAQFKYLMNNAIASKQQLNLAVGVSLSSQQVAALTHDIVWLEEHEVNGEKVLVPVLYLAQADNRLGPTGALIAGNDVSLIAGQNLDNVGTLRAANNLSAAAGNDLVNSGLIEAGNRLDLLAGNDLVNKSGGIIAGRDVTLTALRGDVINERTVTSHQSAADDATWRKDFADSAARIEAANDMSLQAGRDVKNTGSVLQAGRDLSISAGRDVAIDSAQTEKGQTRGANSSNSSITQLSSTVSAGRDLTAQAGRDINVIASSIDAKRDIAMAATENLTLSSAADEQHSYGKSKKVTEQEDHVSQVSADLKAGGSVALQAGQNLDVIASRINAGSNIALDAAQDLTIASAQDESSYFYAKKSKGSFGRSSSKQQESYDSTNVASVINAGQDLTINASKAADGSVSINGGHDVSVIGSRLSAGNDLILGATNDVTVLSGVDEQGSYSKKSKSGSFGLSKSGKSELKTSSTQVASEMSAGNDVVVASGKDITLRASNINAGNDVDLRAGLVDKTGDINLLSANDQASNQSDEYKKKTGLSASGGFLSISSAREAGGQAQSSTSVGSQINAVGNVSLQTERDINIVGSGVNAGANVSLNAGQDVNILAAQSSQSNQDWEKNRQSGIGVSSNANGVTFFAGVDRTKEKNRLEQQSAAASQVRAGEDLTVNAKRDINQVGSDLQALNDINLTAGRNIKIDTARESQTVEQQRENSRNGLSASIDHNYGSTKDAISGAGKGEDATSKGSSTLKAVDSTSQFLSGPTGDGKFGNSKQGTSQQVVETTNRASTLDAGNNLNISASNDVQISGGQLQAGRDINIKGRDVTLDAAKGSYSQETSEQKSWSGIHGSSSGGFKLGVGGSSGIAKGDQSQEASTVTTLQAGRDVTIKASNDLNLIGTQAQAERNINLNAGNTLNIKAAQNDSSTENTRKNGGGEAGIAIGPGGIGVYASVNIGKGDLEREGKQQQEAYLYAGNHLGFTSGQDTNIAGATLRGNDVVGRVGRDFNVTSLPDTGKAQGKEFDLSATVVVGFGGSVSGSVGYGQTNGSKNWIEEQTRITAKDKVDIRTENHTQLDGALIASDSGNLKLDTNTLGYSDIAGKDKEHGYYLNVGGSYGTGSSPTQDSSQVGKGDNQKNGWSVEGWNYNKDREQIVRGTVGAGDVV